MPGRDRPDGIGSGEHRRDRNGTQLQSNILIGENKHALVIPSSCLLPGDSVMLAVDHRRIPVSTGIKTLEWVQILGGLDASQSILTINPGH